MPDGRKEMTMNKEKEEQNGYYEEQIEIRVYAAVAGFTHLAEEVFTEDERNRIIEALENFLCVGNEEGAVFLLYSMFLASKITNIANAVLDVIKIGEENPEVYASFMEGFFDTTDIDEYLVDSWIATEEE